MRSPGPGAGIPQCEVWMYAKSRIPGIKGSTFESRQGNCYVFTPEVYVHEAVRSINSRDDGRFIGWGLRDEEVRP